MTNLTVGDSVVPKSGEYIGYTPGSSYNLPRKAMKVIEGGTTEGYLILDVWGEKSPPVNPNSFVKEKTASEIVEDIFSNLKEEQIIEPNTEECDCIEPCFYCSLWNEYEKMEND